jgi:hypothetical protein
MIFKTFKLNYLIIRLNYNHLETMPGPVPVPVPATPGSIGSNPNTPGAPSRRSLKKPYAGGSVSFGLPDNSDGES